MVNGGYGVRAFGSDTDVVDGNLSLFNDTGGIYFTSRLGAPLIIRNAVGVGNIDPGPVAGSLCAPFANAQSDQPFVNF